MNCITILILFNFSVQYIEIPLYKNYNSYEIHLLMGKQKEQIRLELNMDINFLLYRNNIIDSDSEIQQLNDSNRITIKEGNIKFKKNVSSFTFISIDNAPYTLSRVPFYYILNQISFSDSFPLAYRFDELSLSFIHQLYYDGYIAYKQFGIFYDLHNEKATLFIGGYDQNRFNSTFKYEVLSLVKFTSV